MRYKIATEFSESDMVSVLEKDLNKSIKEFAEDLNDDLDSVQKESMKFIDEEQEEISDYMDSIVEQHGNVKLKDLIPGSDLPLPDPEEEAAVVETNYRDHGDLTHFMKYILEEYPNNIPKHDGKSILGCVKAQSFLERLSNEIQSNIKNDVDDKLSPHLSKLDKVNQQIFVDILKLKSHINYLRNTLKDENKDSMGKAARSRDEDLVKVAGTPNNLVICVSPFIRAITGILINSVVSAGKPFEEVYDYLKQKYQIAPREELEILQVLMDQGQPIFKDRGSMPIPNFVDGKKDLEEKETKLSGIDFISSYFA